MSQFPPPPNPQRFQPPPAPGRFPPPPAAPGGGAPPAPGGHSFAPPPPGGFRPPPPGGGSFAPPPPGGGSAPAGMQQMNAGMGNLSLQQQQPPRMGGPPNPPAPGMFRPPPAPGMFQPPPSPGGGGPPPPGGPPGAPGGPTMFQPPAPPGGGGGPTMFQPPGMMGGPAPPGPPGGGAPPPPGPPGGGVPMFPGAGTAPAAPGMQAPSNNMADHTDYSLQIPKHLFQLTAGKLPQTAAQATACKVPFGAVLRPLAPTGPDDTEICTVQPGTAGIIRCKRCRTYMNPFVLWSEHGRRWRCNICGQSNDTPSAYFCHLDEQGLRRDRFERPELSQAVVEFIAPAEYMVRPPVAPTYFFCLDVSAASVQSGMLQAASRAIKSSLDDLPGRGRTKVGFITFDNAVHYYNLASDLANPQMLVVSDLKELFVPLPDHLLVNLQESRAVVESFLDSLPDMFAKHPVQGQSCLGPALKAAFTVMKQIGGKMCVFQSLLPNLGDGALKPRVAPGMVGTPNEVKLLKPDVTWYKDTAVEFSRQQIAVDMFLFPFDYMDLAALGDLPKYTSGTLHSFVGFNYERDGQRLEERLNKVLTQPTAFEAVMRIRCTKGMRISNFYGNFFVRGTDLLALPNCNTESVFGFDLAHDEQNVASNYVTVQAALLYTSSEGQRRIRVMSQALPVTSVTTQVMASVDTETCMTLLAKQALDVSLKTSLDNARMKLQQVCVDMIRAAKGGDKRTVSGYSVPPPAPDQPGGGAKPDDDALPDNLSLLPLYTLGLMKNVAFRGGTDVHPDERVHAHHLLGAMWVQDTKHFVYPRLFSIHDMASSAGQACESQNDTDDDDKVAGRDRIQLPAVVNLSVEQLSSDGVYLLDNGVEMYLWVGRTADVGVLSALFGVQSTDDLDPNQGVSTGGDPFANRFGAIVQALREDLADPFVISPKINIVREGDPNMEGRFFWFMVEDRASFQGGTYSYSDFVAFCNNPNASAGPGTRPGPGGPPGAPPPPGGPMPGVGMAPPAVSRPVGGMAGMGMGPPGVAGRAVAPPNYGQQQGMPPPHSAPPSMASSSQGQYGGPPPPGPPGGGYGGPPPPGPPGGGYGGPPPPGPPGGGYGGPPPPGPPGGGNQYGGPPPPGPPGGGYRGPPSGPPSGGQYGGPPPSAGPPSGAGRYGAPPPPPGSGGHYAPPPGRAAPQYGRGPPPPRGGPPPPPPPPR